ncbi:MAG: SURF1 family protein [Pseudomonadota bacterium]
MSPAPRGTATGGKSQGYAAANSQHGGSRARSPALRRALLICAALLVAGFAALGSWQLKRLQWKLGLIERVEQRVDAPAVAAPARDLWPYISSENDGYRRVRLTGAFLYELTTRVQAVTEFGSGWWLLTPLRLADGSVVLVNRGFIPVKEGDWNRRDPHDLPKAHAHDDLPASKPADLTSITGLLRMSEPGGAFLHRNDPAAGRWYSRDVQAIARARGLPVVAPYFVDAGAATGTGEEGARDGERPIGGLTVVSFHNNHLVYAVTWYALALMAAGAFLWLRREGRGLPNPGSGAGTDTIDQESDNGGQN